MADRSQPFPIFEKVRYGNGMLVNFKRGKGKVFCTGSCKRVAGLPHCYPVERVTANVLNHISSNGTRTKQSMNIQANKRPAPRRLRVEQTGRQRAMPSLKGGDRVGF